MFYYQISLAAEKLEETRKQSLQFREPAADWLDMDRADRTTGNLKSKTQQYSRAPALVNPLRRAHVIYALSQEPSNLLDMITMYAAVAK